MKHKKLAAIFGAIGIGLGSYISAGACQSVNVDTKAVVENSTVNDVVLSADKLAFPLGEKIKSTAFYGDVYRNTIIPADNEYNFPAANNITFAPGAHSSWHSHGGMSILVTGGIGYYQEEGKTAKIIRKGDVINIPAGVRHFHGATPDSWFSQLVIYDAKYAPTNAEEKKVIGISKAEYANLKAEEYQERCQKIDDTLMFSRAENAFSSANFSGTVYVSNLLAENNAAGAPPIHYVVFEPNVINNWHVHEGGQLLIATDGIGYHQIAGKPLKILRPGDAVFCPPGAKHFHGAGAGGRFAHIAANLIPDKRGVKWLDRLTADEQAKLK